jgi:hypothetical protein
MAKDPTDDQILEAEVVEDTEQETTAVTPSPSDNNATVLLSLEEMIKNNIASIDKLTAELREKRHMFTDSFQNDATFKANEEKAKEANVTKLQTKQQILKQPAVMQLAENIKTMSADLRERKAALSDYLLEYQRMTGAVTIEDLDGNVREIINDAKAVKRSEKK